jgi:hypothetical protein
MQTDTSNAPQLQGKEMDKDYFKEEARSSTTLRYFTNSLQQSMPRTKPRPNPTTSIATTFNAR